MTTWTVIVLAVGYCHLLFVLWSAHRVRSKEIMDLSDYVEDIRSRTANMDEKLRDTKAGSEYEVKKLRNVSVETLKILEDVSSTLNNKLNKNKYLRKSNERNMSTKH